MKKLVGGVAIGLALMATPAFATLWDFNDWTTQGWTLAHQPANGVAPNPVSLSPSPPNDPSDNTGSLYLPDQGYAYLYVPSTNSFKFEGDVSGARFDVNKLASAGLGYRFTHNQNTLSPNTLDGGAADGMQAINAWFEGNSAGSDRLRFKDTYSMAASNTNMAVLKAVGGSYNGTYDLVETGHMTVLYNYEGGVAGDASDGEAGQLVVKWQAVDYTPLPTYPATNFIQVVPLVNNTMTNQPHEVNMIRLGGAYSWSQFYADNVAFVPEPVSMAILGLGALPLLLRRRRC